jgi:hypothetical protein
MIPQSKKLPGSVGAARAEIYLDGCTVAAFASFAKLGAVFSTKNEDGSSGTSGRFPH